MGRQLLYVLFKWRWLILTLFVAFTCAAAIATWLKPPARVATAKILLKGDRIPLQISGLVSQSARIAHSPQVLQSEAELVRSRDVMTPVARALLAGSAPGGEPPQDAIDEKVFALSEATTAVPIPDTNLIQLTYSSPEGAESIRTLKLIVEHYLEQHALANSGSQKLLAMYEREAGRVGDKLRQAEDQLKAWREKHNIVAIDAEIMAALGMLNDRDRMLRQTDSDLQAATARAGTLDRQRKSHPQRLVTASEKVRNPLVMKLQSDLAEAEVALKDVERHPLVGKLKTDVVTAEVQLQDLLQRYTEKDRRVQEKHEQIANLKRELANVETQAEAAARTRVEQLRRELASASKEIEIVGRETTGVNLLRDELEKAWSTAQASATSLDAQRATLLRQVRESAATLNTLGEKKLEADRLTRAVDVQREAYLLYAKKLEEARIAARLDKEQLADVSVAEQPQLIADNQRRTRLMMVGLSSIVGLALGLAIAFALELANNTLRTRSDVEYYLGVPVLAVIPDAKSRQLALAGTAEGLVRR
jgi:uncharacterized protein involved in exopolysaccharide biosynthesis